MTGKDKAYLVAVSRERDELRHLLAQLKQDCIDLSEIVRAQVTDRRRLRAALEEYGRHIGGCTEWRCYCGLAEALTKKAGEG